MDKLDGIAHSTRVALRLDDVGASSKKYEVYSNKTWRFGKFTFSGNWLFIKYLPTYKAWGPYRELNAAEWRQIIELLELYDAKLTVAVTAVWVDSQTATIPFPERYPMEAAAIKAGVRQGRLEVANHGLTHCVVENDLFRPKAFASNREFHREFGPTVPVEVQETHLRESQRILRDWLGDDVVTFVPPGNLFTQETLGLAHKHGLLFVSANTQPNLDAKPVILGNREVIAFHDRELVLEGIDWLRALLEKNKGRQFCFVGELAAQAVRAHGN